MKQLLSNEDQIVLKRSFWLALGVAIVAIIPSFFIPWWKWSFGISTLIGYLASAFCYVKLVYIVIKVTNQEYQKPKKVFVLHNMLNLLIYFVVLLVCQLWKGFNIFFCLFGILTIKIVIVISFGRKKQKVGGSIDR
ncbi:MAG: hypothetical protein NC182_03975 [Prevotella sp.]|nr:hypothetical protein [Staphylococcus sp.]MCM1350338.1 hypothetical protein [Prevotella sp.]